MNKTKILITGASSGIGKAIATELDNTNIEFILTARNTQSLKLLQSQLRAKSTIITADLSTQKGINSVCEKIQNVDVVINNAGFGENKSFIYSSTKTNIDMITVNITALTQITHATIQDMKKCKKSGVILNIASVAGFLPGPYMAVYYATKNYVVSFTQAIAQEVREYGIKIKAVCPGPVQTNFANVANVEKSDLFKHAVSVESIAKYIKKQINLNSVIAIPSIWFKISLFLLRFLPSSFIVKTVAKMQKPR